MLEGKIFTGFIGLNNDFQDMTQEIHLKLDENMSIENFINLNMSNNGGPIAFSINNNSDPYTNGVGHSVVNL